MVTYDTIARSVQAHAGFRPKTCWIAHVKALDGLPVRPARNRRGADRLVPCPADKRLAIEAAFRRLGVLKAAPV
jgi:hypothetical protein